VTVYVDNARRPGPWYATTAYWSHLTADTKDELHAFAERLGLRRDWFCDEPSGAWHYEVTASKRWDAINAGAREITTPELHAIYARRSRARGWT
jgi:hypothetical protein